MLTEDYLIRMINLAIAALLRIIGLKKIGSYEDALQLIDLTFEQLLGLRSNMAHSLDDGRLYYLLTRGDRLDTRRLALIADLFQEEGEIYAAQGRAEESRDAYSRALRYHLEVLFQETQEGQSPLPGDTTQFEPAQAPEQAQLPLKIEWLISQLDLALLGADTLWPLAGYYEAVGEYARAEAVLLLLAGRPESADAIRPEMAAFYRRLLSLPPQTLASGGMTAEEVRERMGRLE